MIDEERIVSPKKQSEDETSSANPVSLRPNSLDEFVGILAEENRKDGYNWERTQFLKTIN